MRYHKGEKQHRQKMDSDEQKLETIMGLFFIPILMIYRGCMLSEPV